MHLHLSIYATRLALGERLLKACRVVDCQTLVEGLPPAAKEGHWPDVIASLIAMAEENWPWQGIIWVYWLFLINHLSIVLRG
jgi:hypothetical protein